MEGNKLSGCSFKLVSTAGTAIDMSALESGRAELAFKAVIQIRIVGACSKVSATADALTWGGCGHLVHLNYHCFGGCIRRGMGASPSSLIPRPMKIQRCGLTSL